MMKRTFAILAALVMIAAASVLITSCGSTGAEGAEGEETDKSYESGIEATQIGAFDTTDLQGNSVTQDVFQEADLTLVNFWGTFCGPCIREMPELQALAEEYAGRVTVLGVISDMEDLSDSDVKEEAEEITTGQGVKFANVVPQGSLKDIADSLQFVPTTVIVDKDGNFVGSPVVGADIEGYKNVIDDYFENN